MAKLNNIIFDPNFLAYRFDFNSECIEFLPIKPAELRQLSFLRADALATNRAQQAVSVPLAEFTDLVGVPAEDVLKNPPRFIFHTAFCASTFVSRSLDIPGKTLSMREPQLLLDAANAKRLQWRSATSNLDYRHLPKIALCLLQKHRAEDERLIIKPINSVNNIIGELLTETGPTKSLILYAGAKRFLLSTLKQGEQARQTTRAMFDLLRCDFPHLAGLSLSNALHMSDLKLVLTLWRLQIKQAQTTMESFNGSQDINTLSAERLDQDTPAVLAAVNRFLATDVDTESYLANLESGVLHSNAKLPEKQFDLKQRDDAYHHVYEFFKDDIENGLRWMQNNNPKVDLEPKLPFPIKV